MILIFNFYKDSFPENILVHQEYFEAVSKIGFDDFSRDWLSDKALFEAHTRRVWAKKATQDGSQNRRKMAKNYF